MRYLDINTQNISSGNTIAPPTLNNFAQNGGVIRGGTKVYRGDEREMEQLQKDSGFVPASILNDGETLVTHAIWQATRILAVDAGVFVSNWKQEKFRHSQYEDITLGKEVNGKKRMSGVACGINAGQKGGHEYEITLPQLYALAVNESKGFKVVIYGDQTSLATSTKIWMNLIISNNAEEMVSLTAIPIDDIQFLR